jgi:hypothetical protein
MLQACILTILSSAVVQIERQENWSFTKPKLDSRTALICDEISLALNAAAKFDPILTDTYSVQLISRRRQRGIQFHRIDSNGYINVWFKTDRKGSTQVSSIQYRSRRNKPAKSGNTTLTLSQGLDWTSLPGLVASGSKPRISGHLDDAGQVGILVIMPKYRPWDTLQYTFTGDGVLLDLRRWY